MESASSVPQFESVSSWRQPVPAPVSPARTKLIDDLAASIAQLSPARLRIAVDGYTAAGKTSLAHELAAALRQLGDYRAMAEKAHADCEQRYTYYHYTDLIAQTLFSSRLTCTGQAASLL